MMTSAIADGVMPLAQFRHQEVFDFQPDVLKPQFGQPFAGGQFFQQPLVRRGFAHDFDPLADDFQPLTNEPFGLLEGQFLFVVVGMIDPQAFHAGIARQLLLRRAADEQPAEPQLLIAGRPLRGGLLAGFQAWLGFFPKVRWG